MIQILPEQLCNKIAAGEVVERPSSVVKELVENSLDAGATSIRVDLERGGKRLIRVTDDGCGMSPDDALLCLERHATSKIASDEDLFRLSSFGFRGEALPSIASVSRLMLKTCASELQGGIEVYAEGGSVKRVAETGMPKGTTLEARNLFFNTPARRKFLRKDETELAHVQEVVLKLALSSPSVQFRLYHGERLLIDAPASGRLDERIASLLGRTVCRGLMPIERDAGEDLSIAGFISSPELSRSTGSAIYTFINGRYIRDKVVQHAVREGYRTLLPKGRYPVTVLFLQLDPTRVDVNVHPTKHEVRFRDQSLVHDFIASSISETLRPGRSRKPEGEKPERQAEPPSLSKPLLRESPAQASSSPDTLWVREELASYRPPVIDSSNHSIAPRRSTGFTSEVPRGASGHRDEGPGPNRATEPEGEVQISHKKYFGSLRVLGQYAESYLLCEREGDLVLIDQHAAHERIRFEELRRQFFSGHVKNQSLLFPKMLEFTPADADLLHSHLELLERLGFDIEHFGGTSFALKAIPAIHLETEAESLMQDLVDDFRGAGGSCRIEEAIEETLMRMACHGVIRAGQPLSYTQMTRLLEEMDTSNFNTHCPHGRPVEVRLERREIEKMFKRT